MIAVETYSELPDLDALRDRWARLWSMTPDPAFSQTYEWFRAAAEAGGGTPRVFAAIVSGRLIGLWPMIERSVRMPFGDHRALACASQDSPSAGLVGPSPAAMAAIVAGHLRQSRGWRSLSFVDSSGAPRGGLAAAFAAAGLSPWTEWATPLGEIHLSGRWTDLLDGCDERTRLCVYRMQYYATDDGCRFERIRPASGAAVPQEIDEALAVAGSLSSSERRLLAATFAAASRRGAADIALLHHHGRAVAASLSFVTAAGLENRFAAVERCAPPFTGVRLLLDLFRDSLTRGDRRFTFAATPEHPAAGWVKRPAPRSLVHVEAPGRGGARLRNIGRGLRAVWRLPNLAGAA
jgi:hypothetical protein